MTYGNKGGSLVARERLRDFPFLLFSPTQEFLLLRMTFRNQQTFFLFFNSRENPNVKIIQTTLRAKNKDCPEGDFTVVHVPTPVCVCRYSIVFSFLLSTVPLRKEDRQRELRTCLQENNCEM